MDTIRITVNLSATEAQALITLAKKQCRHPREQARFEILEGLKKQLALFEDGQATPPVKVQI